MPETPDKNASDRDTRDKEPTQAAPWNDARLSVEELARMSLEELLYYVLVGEGRRAKAEQY